MDFETAYKDFAEKHGYSYRDYHMHKGSFIPQGIKNTKFCILEKNNRTFFAYDSYAGSGASSTTYSAFYFDTYCKLELNCVISKRFPVLDIFKKRHWVGLKEIDNNLTFTGKNIEGIEKLIDQEISKYFLEIWSLIPAKLIIDSRPKDRWRIFKDRESTILEIRFERWLSPEQIENIYILAERIFCHINTTLKNK